MDHPHMSNVGVQGAKPPEAQGVYSMFNAKYRLNLLYFNRFFLQNFTQRKKVVGIITWAISPPPISKSRGDINIYTPSPPGSLPMHCIMYVKDLHFNQSLTRMGELMWESAWFKYVNTLVLLAL